MKNLNPAARQKLAILLKNKEHAQGLPQGSPMPGALNIMHTPAGVAPISAPIPSAPPMAMPQTLHPFNPISQGEKMQPNFFGIKKKLTGFKAF